MRHLLALLALAAASQAHAAIPDGLTTTCNGAFSQSWSDAIVLDCAGDLSLTGTQADVRVTSVTSITLRAGGMLQLLNLTLDAPVISLNAGGEFDFQNAQLLTGSSAGGSPTPPAGGNIGIGGPGRVPPIGDVGGPIQIEPGGNIGLPGSFDPPVIAVPEPATWALLLAGLTAVAVGRRAPGSARR